MEGKNISRVQVHRAHACTRNEEIPEIVLATRLQYTAAIPTLNLAPPVAFFANAALQLVARLPMTANPNLRSNCSGQTVHRGALPV